MLLEISGLEKLSRMAEEADLLPPPFPDRKHDDRDRSQDRIPGVEVYPPPRPLPAR
jgi:hypothetical protein